MWYCSDSQTILTGTVLILEDFDDEEKAQQPQEHCLQILLHSGLFFYIYKFNIKIYNLRITYDYERSTIQYHKTIPRGAKDHDYPRAIHMKNINLKLQLNIQLRETITNNGTEKRDSMIGERYKNEHGVVA